MIRKLWNKISPPNPNIKKLQDTLGITVKEAKKTDALIRSTIGPLEDDIASTAKRISKLIKSYTESLSEDECTLICNELTSYYMKRDKDWKNGEDTFCVIAYIFTFFSLIIDSIDTFDWLKGILRNFSNETHVISSALLVLAFLSVLGGIAITAKVRKTGSFPAWFAMANKWLPTLTILTYWGYYCLKHGYTLDNSNVYYIHFAAVPYLYLAIGALIIIPKLVKFKHAKQIIEDDDSKNNSGEIAVENVFHSDKPISSASDDLLKRGSFAKLLAETVMRLDKSDTFTVGVFGKWGSGKTSIVKMMLQELRKQQLSLPEEEKTIVVHFEPWNFTDTNQLLNQFFARLANEFRSKGDKGLKTIGDALEKYSDAFSLAELIPEVGFAGNVISFLGKSGAKAAGKFLKKRVDSSDVQQQKEYVISLLEKQPCKILVIIDDIDRLSNEQIRHVFQLVTSVAKFPNTIYMLVFDKDIVVRALERVQEGSGEDYLEKIIQMPIQIPDIQRSALRQVLFNRLDEIITRHSDVNFVDAHWQNLYNSCVDPFVNHIRDVNRLCNAIEFKLSAISGEVDFADMVAITALEMGMPPVYEWIKANKPALTGEFDFSVRDRKPEEWCKLYKEQIEVILAEHKSDAPVYGNAEFALKCLAQIFPHFGRKIGKHYESFTHLSLRKNNQVAHPDKFDRYFHLTLDYIGFRRIDVTSVLRIMNSAEVCEFILQKDKENASYELLEEIRAEVPELSAERAKILIDALLKTGSQLDDKSGRSMLSLRSQDLAEYIIYDLFERIPVQERQQYIIDIVNSADCECLATLSGIINMLELAYGRLAAEGQERSEFAKLLSLEGLLALETAFADRVKEVMKDRSLLTFRRWRMILHLLENFDANFISEYMPQELLHDESILRYIEGSVSKWIGSEISYEVSNDYEKYLSKDQVLNAINNQRQNRNLYSLPQEVQVASVAFYLHENEGCTHRHSLTSKRITETLDSWSNI